MQAKRAASEGRQDGLAPPITGWDGAGSPVLSVSSPVVVIGSGIGGTVATMLLAHAGVRVLLLEKNRVVGGACAAYDKRGFRIDYGTHLFSRGPEGPLGAVLRRVGRPGAISFRQTRDIAEIRTRGHDGGLLCVPVPTDRRRYAPFISRLARAMRLPPPELARAVRLFTQILAMSDEEVDAWNDYTIEDFIRPYTAHPATVSLFGFLLGLYFILPYWEVSAGEALWSFRKMVRDNWLSYPLGGASAIPETYRRIAESFGAEVRTGTGVRRVIVEGGRAVGVELEDGTRIGARAVISTSSVRTTVGRLVGPEHFPADYADRARAIQGSFIAVQAKIALDRKLVSAGALVGGVGQKMGLFDVKTEDLKAMFGTVMEGRVPPIVPFYCPVPTNFDPTLAPPGHQLLTVCAVAPTTDVALVDPGPVWEEAMLEAMRTVVPGLDRHVLFVDRMSAGFIEHWIGKEFGPAVSTGQTPAQVGRNRPGVTTPLRGLYLAGCGAGARGVGTELAAASAIECVDRLLGDLSEGPRASQVSSGAMRLPTRARTRTERAWAGAVAAMAWATR